MILVTWHWEARELDGTRNALPVDKMMMCETVEHGSLGTIHMVGCKVGVRCTARNGNRIASRVDHLLFGAITSTNPAQIPDVVCECSDDEMQPIILGHVAGKAQSTQDVLRNQSYQRSMFGIVIKGVTGRKPFHNEPCCLVEFRGNALKAAAKAAEKDS